MARKKTQEEINAAKEKASVIADEQVKAVDETSKAVEEKVENVAKPSVEKVSKTNVKADIPDFAKKLLKLYDDCEELFVSPSGSVFTPDTKPAIRGNAILYKNPYFNNSKINN